MRCCHRFFVEQYSKAIPAEARLSIYISIIVKNTALRRQSITLLDKVIFFDAGQYWEVLSARDKERKNGYRTTGTVPVPPYHEAASARATRDSPRPTVSAKFTPLNAKTQNK